MARHARFTISRRSISGRIVAFRHGDLPLTCNGTRSEMVVSDACSCGASWAWWTWRSRPSCCCLRSCCRRARDVRDARRSRATIKRSSRSRSPRRETIARRPTVAPRRLRRAARRSRQRTGRSRTRRAAPRSRPARRRSGARCSRRRSRTSIDSMRSPALDYANRALRGVPRDRQGDPGTCPSWEQIAHGALPAAPRRRREVGHRSAARPGRVPPRRRARRCGRSTSAAARSGQSPQPAGLVVAASAIAAPWSIAAAGLSLSMRRSRLAVAGGGAAAMPPVAATARTRRMTAKEIVEQSSAGDRADRGRRSARIRVGTGFIVDASGLIATNLHVVGGERQDPRQAAATGTSTRSWQIAGSITDRDLALLRIQRRRRCRRQARRLDKLFRRRSDLAIGNPLGVFDYRVGRADRERARVLHARAGGRGAVPGHEQHRSEVPPDLRADLAGLERRAAVQPVRRGRSA